MSAGITDRIAKPEERLSESHWSIKRVLLMAAIVTGIFIPGIILGISALEGWHLPTWLSVSLPIILIGSVRGTAVLLGWKAFRWSLPRLNALKNRLH